MAHELAFTRNGEARFAYNEGDGLPWHRLGKAVAASQADAETMLRESKTDFFVSTVKLAAVDENGEVMRNADGSLVLFEDNQGTLATLENGHRRGLAAVGSRYSPEQNRVL